MCFHHLNIMPHSSITHGNSSISCKMSTNKCMITITALSPNSLPPKSKQCYWPNISSHLKKIFIHIHYIINKSQVLLAQKKTYLQFVQYPHHIHHTIIMTKDAFFFAQRLTLSKSLLGCPVISYAMLIILSLPQICR